MLTRRQILTFGCLGLCVLPAIYVSIYVMAFASNFRSVRADDYTRMKLRNDGLIAAVQHLNETVENDECVLVFRLADYGYYGQHCYFSYLDSRLIPLYKSSSTEEALEFLERHNIRYVMRPGYGMAEVYNSPVGEILGNPAKAELLTEYQGTALFRLRGPEETFGRTSTSTVFSSSDFHLRHHSEQSTIEHDASIRKLGINSSFLTTGAGSDLSPVVGYEEDLYNDEVLLTYSVTLEGDTEGYITVGLVDYNQLGRQGTPDWNRKENLLWDGFIDKTRVIRGQLLRRAGSSKRFRVVVSLTGPGSVAVREMTIQDFGPSALISRGSAQWGARQKGWDSYSDRRDSDSWDWGVSRDHETGDDSFSLNVLNDRSYVLASGVQALPENTNELELQYEVEHTAPYRVVAEWLGKKRVAWYLAAVDARILKVVNMLEKSIFDDVLRYSYIRFDEFDDDVVEVIERSPLPLERDEATLSRQTLTAPPLATNFRLLFIFDVEPRAPVEKQRELIIRNLSVTSTQ